MGWAGFLKSCYHESGQSASGADERNIPGFPGTEFGYSQQHNPADLLEYFKGEIQTNSGWDHVTIPRRYFQSIELTYNIPYHRLFLLALSFPVFIAYSGCYCLFWLPQSPVTIVCCSCRCLFRLLLSAVCHYLSRLSLSVSVPLFEALFI